MKEKTQGTSAGDIIRRKFYKDHPKRQARLEKARRQVALGDQIRRVREAANLTQADLADMVDSSPSAISRLEDADYEGYSVRTLRKIAEAVGMELSIEFRPHAQPC